MNPPHLDESKIEPINLIYVSCAICFRAHRGTRAETAKWLRTHSHEPEPE